MSEDRQSGLAEAIRRGTIEIVLQPIVHLRSGRAARLEAMPAWSDADGTSATREEITAVAKAAGLFPLLTLRVARDVARHLSQWQVDWPALSANFDVSLVSLLDASFQQRLLALLEEEGCDPTGVGIQVSENTLLAAPEAAGAALTRLQDEGLHVVIDQFGTGYSSLAQLIDLPIDAVKIDARFIGRMTEDHRNEAIVRASITLAHDLGIEAVAIGVPDRETWDLLRAMGCDEAQGAHVAAPLPAAEVPAWLRNWEATMVAPPAPAAPATAGDVLVVEDDPTLAEVIRDVLEHEGFEVVLAADGQEALRKVEQRRPSLVLLDMQMPMLDGPGFAKALRERGVTVPIVVMTAGSSAARWARELRADDYLSKPFDIAGLIDVAGKYAGRH